MEIAIITRHAVANYGSILQTLATQHVLNTWGYPNRVVDYVRTDEFSTRLDRTQLKLKPAWNANPIKRAVYLALRVPASIMAGHAFAKARHRLLTLTKPYHSAAQLKADPPTAEVLLTGSDQVWGPTGSGEYDGSYFLDFGTPRQIRCAYAASFGRTQLPDGVREQAIRWLQAYKRITVREDAGVQMLAEWGVHAEQVLDPTLLLTAQEWQAYCEPIRQHKPYVLVYQIHNDARVNILAKAYAKHMGYPLVRITATLHQCLRGGRMVYLPTPGQWLSYLQNAACVVTDSFHGMAFSIQFGTPFLGFMPDNGTNSRNRSLLALFGLQHRSVNGASIDFDAIPPVNVAAVQQTLAHHRDKSLSILRAMLQDAQRKEP